MNYTLMITEQERQTLAEAFGILARKLSNAAPVLDEKSGADHAKALLSPPAAAQPTHPTTPIELRDRWAKDRKGKELPNPEGCQSADVHLWKTEQKGKYLRVTWQNNGTGHGYANCFDPDLWPWLIKQSGQLTRLYITRKGEYTNIVGVRA